MRRSFRRSGRLSRHRVGRHLGGPALTLAVLGMTAGCAQIFGLDETSLEPPVSFTLKRYAVGTTVVVEPIDLTAGTATYLIPDPLDTSGFRKVSTTSPAIGRWQGEIPLGTDAQLRYTIPDDTVTRHLALPRREINALHAFLGKPAKEAAPTDAALAFSVTLEKGYAAGESLQWISLGAWTSYTFPSIQLPAVGATTFAPGAIPFNAATAFSPGPMDATHPRLRSDDALLVLRRAGANNVLTGVFTAPPFDLMSGMNPVAGPMVAVPPDQALGVALDTTAPVTRMASARPTMGVPTLGWQITAAPGAAAGFPNGPALAFANLAPSGGMVTLAVSYGNPFAARSWPATFMWSATSTRTYQQPSGLPAVTLSAQFSTISTVPTDNTPRDFTSCLPTSIAVQGATLVTDGLTVTLDRTKPVTVSFVADRLDSELYTLTLHEVVNTAGVATLTPRFESLGPRSSWTLPGDIFEAGKIYTVRAGCSVGGYPGLSTGDLELRQLPISRAFLDSGVFTVMQ